MPNVWAYRVVSADFVSPDGYAYRGYGIAVKAGRRELAAEDLFTSLGQAEAAAGLLNRRQVSPKHMMDVLEDMLVD
jgi:hypothetical protein